jgi:4-hydroxy-3-polyprenylbenzoate decarboxylase
LALDDLRDFLAALEKEGELAVIDEPVDPHLEITEVTDRAVKAGGPALLFRRPQGFDMPVLTNQMASHRRMQMALRVGSYEELESRVRELVRFEAPGAGMREKLKALGRLKDLADLMPNTVKEGPCQEVVYRGDEVNLGRLPVLTCWPLDGGPFITLPLVFTRDPVSGRRNAGMYRLQVYDERTTGMHWHLHKDAAEQFRAAGGGRPARPAALEGSPVVAGRPAGAGRFEVAVAIGADPAVTYAATAPLPRMLDEMLLAGFLRGKPVDMVKCLTVDVEVPAHAEIVLEGYVEPGEIRTEGPFGDHTGYYSLADQYPVFHLTAMTHRQNPIYAATIVGVPPQEDAFIGKATERLFLPLLQMQLPEVVDMDLPVEGVFHNCAILSVRKAYPLHARKLMHAVWGLGQMQFTKTVLVVDEDVDVHDYAEVAWRAFNNVDPERDVLLTQGPLDALDHSSPTAHWGAKMGIDATRKWPEEGHPREWPPDIVMSPEVVARVDELWPRLGLDAFLVGRPEGGSAMGRTGGAAPGPRQASGPGGPQAGGRRLPWRRSG